MFSVVGLVDISRQKLREMYTFPANLPPVWNAVISLTQAGSAWLRLVQPDSVIDQCPISWYQTDRNFDQFDIRIKDTDQLLNQAEPAWVRLIYAVISKAEILNKK